MTTILISVAIIAILLAFTLGRWSKSIDINRQLHDIEVEGVALAGIDDVCRVISRLGYQKQELITELNQLRNSNNAYQKNIEQLKDDYYKVMSQLRDKRDELGKAHDKYLEYNNQVCNKAIYLDKITDQLHDSLIDYGNKIDKCGYSAIYATKMKNKQILLSIGEIEIAANGKITHDANCRTLGLVNSKENQWASGVDIPQDMAIGAPVLISVIYHKNVMQKLTKPMGELVKKASEISLKGNELNCYSLSNIHLI